MTSCEDTIVDSIITKFKTRSEIGIEKYGTTLDRKDLSLIDWLNHAQEEHMDAILYLEKVRKIELSRTVDSEVINRLIAYTFTIVVIHVSIFFMIKYIY